MAVKDLWFLELSAAKERKRKKGNEIILIGDSHVIISKYNNYLVLKHFVLRTIINSNSNIRAKCPIFHVTNPSHGDSPPVFF